MPPVRRNLLKAGLRLLGASQVLGIARETIELLSVPEQLAG